jgi:hypothetical protein
VFFTQLLRNILAGKSIPEDVSSWGKRLCAQVIGRLLWDLKQLQVSDYLGLPSLAKAQRQTNVALLRGLNTLSDAMISPTSSSDLISFK